MTDPGADLSRHFADLVSTTSYRDLGSAAVEAARRSILDTVGVSLAASGAEPAIRPVLDHVVEAGGRSESTVLGIWKRTPATQAALANGALAHALDFDDQTPYGQHASSSVVTASLALAERSSGVSGTRLIEAVALGQDVFVRLRCNVGWRKDWNLSSVFGTLAATAAAAKILDLTGDQTQHAFSLASQQAGGVMEVVAGTGGQARGFYAGFSAQAAVLAALLAQRNVTGVDSLFEGVYGLMNTYFGGDYDRDAILAGLGSDFRGAGSLYKPWPTVGTAHAHIQATIDLIREHTLDIDEIEEFRVYVGDYHRLMCEPLQERRNPSTLVDARFSLPFIVAVAVARGKVTIADFSAAGLADETVRGLARRVVPIDDSALDWRLELPPARVEAVMRDGSMFQRWCAAPLGSASAPMSWDDLTRKFEHCATLATDPPAPAQVAAAIEWVRVLEQVADAGEFGRILTPGRRGPTKSRAQTLTMPAG